MYRRRVVFTIVALAVASAAAATIRWQTWTPNNACLLCGAPDPSSTMRAAAGPDTLYGAGGGAPSYARTTGEAFTPGPLAAAQLGSSSTASSSSAARSTSSFRGWQPWGNGSASGRFASSGAAGAAAAPLGGLWRLMSLSRPHHSSTPAARNIVARVRRERPPVASRPKKPSPGSNSGHPGNSGDGTAASETPAPPLAGAPSTDPFHEHEAPPPDPFQGPGGFDPGTPGGKGPSTGGGGIKMAATPEPGSILLFGTGLLGVLGVMRQRRLI